MDDLRCTESHEHAAKCYAEAMGVAPAMAAYTWDDVDAQMEVLEQTEEVQRLTRQYNGIVQSIIGAAEMEPSERARLLSDAATGYAARVGASRAEAKADRPGVIGRLLGRKVTNSEGLGPDDYAVVPAPDKPSTWRLRIDDKAHISAAIQAMSPAGFRGEKAQLTPAERKAALGKIRAALGRMSKEDMGDMMARLDAIKALGTPTEPGQVVLFAGKAGGYERFALWASNNFVDRTGEVFPAAVLESAVARFNARDGAKGHANVWHVGHPKYGWPRREMTDWGEIEHAAYVDGHLLVEGRVTDPAAATKIKAWGDREPLGTSIEYEWQPGDLVDGVYHAFDFDRVSVVPREHAANPWGPNTTVYLGKGEGNMPIIDEKIRESLATIYGDEQVVQWEQDAAAKSTELRAAGHAAKALKFELPGPTITFVEAVKDGEASAADATPATADGGAPDLTAAEAVPATDETPPWARALADQNAAILARLDQTDAGLKSVKDELDNAAPAVGILGRSVQDAGVKASASTEVDAQERALAAYRASGVAPTPGAVDVAGMDDWGVASKVLMGLNGAGVTPPAAGS